MSKFEMMRGRTMLQNLNNARIRYSRAKEAGTSDAKALAHEVAYLQAMWREHVKRSAAPTLDSVGAIVETLAAANAMAA
jgi:hypothetical protein